MLTFEKLDSTKHNRAAFDCGVVELNNYLQHTASQHINNGTANTFILADEDAAQDILGYFTLVFSQVEPEVISPSIIKKVPKHRLPVALLGRLAVDVRHKGHSYGDIMVMEAITRVLHAAETVGGLVGLRVDAKTEGLKNFYQRFGFLLIPDSMSLFLPITTMRAIVSAAGKTA